MSRTIYLTLFSNGPKPAHYAVFIPTGDAGQIGKLIHVTGTTATGFFLQFVRNYDFGSTQRTHRVLPLALVDARYIKDIVGDEQQFTDTIARDRLESVATIAPPPGPSPNPFDSSAPNYQTWIQDYVQKLVVEGVVPGSAALVVESAPRLL